MPRLLLALLTILPATAQLLINTYAGGVIPTGVPAQNVSLGVVRGIAWDPNGNIVIADATNNVIRRIGTDGIISTIVGTGVTAFSGDGGPATSASINYPWFPVYDPTGNLYFYDFINYRIRRVDTHGIIATIAGDGQPFIAGLDSEGPATARSIDTISGLTVDASGNVYFSESREQRIRRVTPAGNLEIFATLTQPGELAADGQGNIYALNAPQNFYPSTALLRISPAGAITTLTAISPYDQSSVTADLAGNVYAAYNGQLLRYASDGTVTAVAMPDNLGGLLAVDPNGNIAFPSTIGPVVQKLTAGSLLSTVAGENPQPAPDGTPLSQTWFLGRISIAFSPAGDLYIAEYGPCLIRKISASGVLSTFAGTGTCGTTAPAGTAKTANLTHPYVIAVDGNNNVWIGPNLYSISQVGVISAPVPLPAVPGPFTLSINAIAFDAKGRLYIQGMMSLYRLSGNTWQTIVAPPANIGSPSTPLFGLGSDSSGNVYFSEQTNTYVVNDDGTYTLKYPNFGALALAFDSSGNVWGSGFSGSLLTSNPTGIASVGFGPATDAPVAFDGDGGPVQSAVVAADGPAFGPDGNLYFVDGSRIRRVTGSGPSTPPVISQGGIVNAISYAGGSVAPGELISIFGSNFGASALQLNAAVNNAIRFTIGRTKVLFNGTPGAITAMTPSQINVFVPFEVATPVNIQVQIDNILSTPVTVPVVATALGFSPSILNQDGTVNTASNPAPRGSIVSFYGTGLGAMNPQLADGNLAISTPFSTPINPPTVTIGGQPAQILYAGDAPGFPTGVFQINATIPANITPGAASVNGQVIVFVK